MQTLYLRFFVAFLILSANSIPGQVVTNVPPSTGSNTNDWPQPGQGWRGIPRDWASTEWRMTELPSASVAGQSGSVTHSYFEVGNGINYLDTSGPVPVWKTSADTIELMTNGAGAAAVRGPTRVYFPPVLGGSNAPLTLITASNNIIHLQPIGLYFFDSQSGRSVLLASLRPTEGELLPPNRVVYKSAFDGVQCDLMMTYNRGFFESDLVILQRPNNPSFYGLSNSTTKLELWHSIDGPVPLQKPLVLESETDPTLRAVMAEPDFIDETLDWGDLFFPQGRAFSWDTTEEINTAVQPVQIRMPNAGPADALVAKRYGLIGGRPGLLEAVRWDDIAPLLASLPPAQGALSDPRRGVKSHRELPPATPEADSIPKVMKIAGNGYRAKGVLWDYIGVSGGTTYTFSSNVTYYVSSPAVFSSTVNFNPACIIKFGNNAYLYPQGTVYCYGTAANPSILTSMHDNAFGQQIQGSSGYQTYSGNPIVWLYNNSQTLNYMRFRWAQVGARWDSSIGGVTNTLSNSSFEWCQTGVYASNCAVKLQSSTKCTVNTPVAGAASWSASGSLTDTCTNNDSNGLPLSWESEYFGTNNVSTTSDPDADGLSNQAELNDGTSPLASDLPQILIQPINQLVAQGNPATFSVTASGTGTLTYQWIKGGVAIAGATASTYTISNVQLGNCDNYSVVITNTCGTNSTTLTVTSSNAFLSVATPASGTPLGSGAISWWKAENNGADSIGTNTGTLYNSATYAAGKVGQAFSVTNSTGYIQAVDSPSLNQTNALTLEGWAYVSSYSANDTVLVMGKDSSTFHEFQIVMYTNSGHWSFYALLNLGGNLVQCNGSTAVSLATWYHVALTYDGYSLKLYVNGSLDNSATGSGSILTTTDGFLFGGYGTGPWTLSGRVDEATLYNRALSSSEIQSLYAAGSAGKYTPPSPPTITAQPQSVVINQGSNATFTVGATGTAPLYYQWLFNSSAISGATSSSYTVTNAGLANVGLYSAVVANPGGSVVSSSASLGLTCDSPPSGLIAWWRGEGDGTDAVGGNDGKYCGSSPGFGGGKVGQGFYMNPNGWGPANYLRVPSSSALKLTSVFTVELWYKDTGSENYWVGLFGKVSPVAGYSIHLLAGNSLAMTITDPTYGFQGLSISTPSANNLHHLAAIWQQSGSTNITMTLFVDGVWKNSGTFGGNLANIVNDAPFMIGTDQPTGDFFTGIIDEVAVYSRALSTNEIVGIYNAGTMGKCVPSLPVSISVQPTNQTVAAGSDVVFNAQGTGSGPLWYQWLLNTSKIANATNRFFITNSVQLAQNGQTYSVIISNTLGSVTSAVATLTVTSAPACVSAPSGLVAWWRAESNAVDQIGGNNGVVLSSTTFTNGKSGLAFNFPGFSSYSCVDIPSSPTLKLTNALTFELWYKCPLGGNGGGTYGLLNKYPIPELCCCSSVPANYGVVAMDDYYMTLYFWDTNTSSTLPGIPYWPPPLPGVFHHLAVTYHQLIPTQVQITLYIDGQSVLSKPLSGNLANALSDTPVTLGAWWPDGHASFPGVIDEAAIYSRALSAADILSLYNAGSGGKCAMNVGPTIVNQPMNQIVAMGSEVALGVLASGTPPLTYQWQLDSLPIAGATNSVFVLNNAQASAAGSYNVLVTNGFGLTFSQPASITVTSSPACDPPPPNLISWWRGEGDASDCIGTNGGTLVGSVGFGAGKVNEGFTFNGASYVQVPSSSSLRLTNAFTVECWYKDTGSSSTYCLASKAKSSPGAASFSIFGSPNRYIAAGFQDPTNNGGGLVYVECAPVPMTGMFHHLAATYQQTDSSHIYVNLFLDGQCAAGQTLVGNLASAASDSAPIAIGAQPPFGWNFTGIIDEVSIYSRVLSSSEIQAIYNAGAMGKCFSDMPYVTITTPTNSAQFTEVATVGLTATTYDENAVVTNVQFWAGTNFIGTAASNSTSWTWSWGGRTSGHYGIRAVATDSRGISNSSAPVTFLVNPTHFPPIVSITYPTNNGIFSAGSDITITATASPSISGGAVTNVAFFVNGAFIGNDPTNPHSITKCCWSPGTYALTAEAMDTYGSVGVTTNLVMITISGTTPSSGNGFWDPFFGNPGNNASGNPVTAMKLQGSTLYFGTPGETINGTYIYSVGQWDGTNWSDMSGPSGGRWSVTPYSMLFLGTNLYAGGLPNPTDNRSVARWLGTVWTNASLNDLRGTNGNYATVWTLAAVGSDLYCGGNFVSASGDTNVQYVARLNPSSLLWEKVGNINLNGPVYALATVGNTLFAAGAFTNAGGDPQANYIAQLSGNSWANVGGGVSGTNPAGQPGIVYALAVCGSNVFVGGDFTAAGGNTNANGVAEWSGSHWIPIQGGLVPATSSNSFFPSYSVMSLAVQGRTLYAGGAFTAARRGTNQFPVNGIAKAAWSEDTQTWTWTDLDQGLSPGDNNYLFVRTMALMPGASPNAYDLFVGGKFGTAGSVPVLSKDLGRWSVGRPYPTNSAPSITITYPANDSAFTNPPTTSIGLSAWVTPGTATVSTVTFIVDGTNFLTSSSSGNPYSNSVSGLTFGSHTARALVADQANLTNISSPIVFTVASTNTGTLLAYNDFFTVMANSVQNCLPVLTNDVSSSPMKIVDTGPAIGPASCGSSSLGMVSVSYNGSNIVYTPTPDMFGTNVVYYTVTNSNGNTSQAFATIKIACTPQIQITNPPDGLSTNATSNLTISGTAFDWDGKVNSVQLVVNGVTITPALTPNSSGAWSTNWSQSTPGFYTFLALATDNDGYVSASSPVTVEVTSSSTNNHPPIAVITSAWTGGINTNNVSIPASLMVTNGQLAVTGYAYDPDGDPVSWQFVLIDPSRPGSAPLYNVTPGPLNSQGYHTGAITNASFGTLDLSLVQNGGYQLTLNVRGGGDYATAILRIGVASNLKIGQFSFSEQDLSIPVNGIPITVTRTYNSINPMSSDFGYGWSFAINSMDVQVDEVRTNLSLNSLQVVDEDVPYNSDLPAPVVSVRSGGGRDVTLTLPDGRRTTFVFIPTNPGLYEATALWTNVPDVHATLTLQSDPTINLLPLTISGYDYDYSDFPGWILQAVDHTQYYINRGQPVYITYDPTGTGGYVRAQVYGPPVLSSIVQPTGDTLIIGTNGISHYTTNSPNVATRSVFFDRDSQGRIIAVHDPISGSNGVPVVQYVYNQDTGNLIQVLKLIDRVAGTYSTNKYFYSNQQFPHYITEIDNGIGAPILRNFYDSSGRLSYTVDANYNTNQFIHNLTNSLEIAVDPLGRTNTFGYDSRGNITAVTNAMGGVTLSAFDGNNNKTNEVLFLNGTPYATNNFTYDPNTGLLLTGVNALGFTNTLTYNSFGQVATSTDTRGNTTTNYYDPTTGNLVGTSDALGNPTTNFFDGSSLFKGSQDAVGTLTTNFYDNVGNLTGTASFSSATMLGTNSFGYDLDGNRTNSTVWRKVNGSWVGATTTFIYDGQNRVVQTIEPDGGTNSVAFDAAGRPTQTIDKLGRPTTYTYDFQGRLIQTTYSDSTTEISTYDPAGNRTNSVDRAGRTTTYVFDALNRLTQTIYPDTTSNTTVYDDLGRIKFSVDARGMTNAFGYDVANRSVAVTNGWGTGIAITNLYAFDAAGNPVYFTNTLGQVTTNVFDALNRRVQVLYPDGTKVSSGFDIAGRHVAETNQDGIVTLFGYVGGRIISVTNAFGKPEQMITRYDFDEAGNILRQIDALNRTNSFTYDGLARRVTHTMPGGQSESFGYDFVGNLAYHTNFNNVVITNQYDVMNRLTNRASVNGYKVSFGYSATDQRTNMTDMSGTTSFTYDNRDRLTNKVVSWTGGPAISLNYRFDANGNLTNLWSSSSGGVTNYYQFDALNRLTNVLANGNAAAGYGFDAIGNLKTMRYGNGVTNQFQYDVLNRLTNIVWKTNAGTIASFYYQLGATGKRTNLSEVLNGTSRTYAWTFDSLYRLKQEALGGGTSGTLSYGFDPVGNRTNRTVTGGLSLTNQSFTFGTNDWLTSDSYDNNGNTTASSGNSYQFDALNHLTNQNNGAVLITYNGDGIRVKKTVGSTTTFYLVDDRNPSGYAQVLEEWTASGGTTNLSRLYNYGLNLISQRQPNTSTNYFVFDGHGSARVLTDNGGNVVNAFAFDAFGNLIASNAAPQTVYLYDGQQWDPDIGQYYLRDRTLNPGTGRFTTRDLYAGSREDPPSLHRYLYCTDDPVNLSDRTGRDGSYTAPGQLAVTGTEGIMARLVLPTLSRTYAWTVNKVITAIINPQLTMDYLQLWAGYLTAASLAVEAVATTTRTIIDNVTKNTAPIPSQDTLRGVALEKIAAQRLGKIYLGGNVSTIDLYDARGSKLAISIKSYDLSTESPMYEQNMINRVTSDIKELQKLDTIGAYGTTASGTEFKLAAGEAQFKVLVALVPEDKSLVLRSRNFLTAVRNAAAAIEEGAEESRAALVLPLPVKGWQGKR